MELVIVHWEDSCSRSGWQRIDTTASAPIISVGWLVAEDEDVVTLSTSWDYETGTIDPLNIPKCSIQHLSVAGEL